MQINIKTKLNVGDEVYLNEDGKLVPVEIGYIDIHFYGNDKFDIIYVGEMENGIDFEFGEEETDLYGIRNGDKVHFYGDAFEVTWDLNKLKEI